MKKTPVSSAEPRKESIDLALAYEAIEPVDKGLPLSPLMRTIYNSNDRLFQELLEQGHSLEQRNYRGDTPLMVAIGHKHDPTIEAILQTKPDITAKNVCGDTAINYALVFAGKDFARKIQPDLQDDDLDQLLAELDLNIRIERFKGAVKKGDLATVEKMLTAKEIDINFVGPDDRPLWLAMEAFDLAMVQRLLAYGADPSLFYIGIIHAFDLAKSSKKKAIKSFFFALKKEWKLDPEKSKLLTQGILGDIPDTDDERISGDIPDTDDERTPPPKAEPKPPKTKPKPPKTKPKPPKTKPNPPKTKPPKSAPPPKALKEAHVKAVLRGEWTGKGKAAKQPAPPTKAQDALPSGARLQKGRTLERGETPLPMPPGIAGRLSLQWNQVELPIHPATAETWGPALALKTACVGRLVYQGTPLEPTETEAEVFLYSHWTDDGGLLAYENEDLGGREGFFCAGLLAALKAKQPLFWEKTGGEDSIWRLEIRDRWDLGVFLGYEAETYQIDLHAKTLQWSHCWVSYHFAT